MVLRMVYHGGMPYITKVQDKDKDDLFVTRNSTAECFDLLIKDLDDAISLLPAKAKWMMWQYSLSVMQQ